MLKQAIDRFLKSPEFVLAVEEIIVQTTPTQMVNTKPVIQEGLHDFENRLRRNLKEDIKQDMNKGKEKYKDKATNTDEEMNREVAPRWRSFLGKRRRI